jgi:hypothetical protein
VAERRPSALPPASEKGSDMGAHENPKSLRYAIITLVNDALESGAVLNSSSAASEIVIRFPDCRMTIRDIEDEIILQVGIAHGIVEFGSPATSKTPRAAAPRRKVCSLTTKAVPSYLRRVSLH